jgi:hypothetical protein
MDEYGIHFPEVQQQQQTLLKLKRKREDVAQQQQKRISKLPSLDEMPICCRRLCCCGAISTPFLADARQKYIACNDQPARKTFLLTLRDINSPTKFALVKGGTPMCYRAMRAVFGCSMDLLSSVVGTAKAKSSPYPHRPPRLGMFLL